MLRAIVENFLSEVTEREFDGPLMALLASQGFKDVHFTHGAFEFGKDVVAKKSINGAMHQFAIQSKAGDLNLSDWRAVRPQLEEAGYNAISHPSFDTSLPRAVVLVTTGRLRGAASADAQSFGRLLSDRKIAEFDVWDQDTLAGWMLNDPSAGLPSGSSETDLLRLVAGIRDRTVTDSQIEAYSRRWCSSEYVRRAPVEASILGYELRLTRRLDLVAQVALCLIRCSSVVSPPPNGLETAAWRYYESTADDLIESVGPLVGDPADIARATMGAVYPVTYLVASCRLAEHCALLLIRARQNGDPSRIVRAEATLRILAGHPGTHRPPSDLFAASVIAMAVALRQIDAELARAYVRSVLEWVLDRHDPDHDGLGLASVFEDEYQTIARLLGGTLTTTSLSRRTSSYLATVLLDLMIVLAQRDLYDAARANFSALLVVPDATLANEALAHWARSGAGTVPRPVVNFDDWDREVVRPGPIQPPLDIAESIALILVCRSRHERRLWVA